jgi:hypothetical protein
MIVELCGNRRVRHLMSIPLELRLGGELEKLSSWVISLVVMTSLALA